MTRTRALLLIIGLLIVSGAYTIVEVRNASRGLRRDEQGLSALAHQNHALILQLAGEQGRLSAAESQLRSARKGTVKLICHTEDQLVGALRGLIIGGAKSSFIFEKLFRQYHAPPYKARVRKAVMDAKTLQPLDCPALK